VTCPDHHFRAWGYCPYCGETLHSTSREVMNPPAQAEAGNLANTAPRQADHEAARRRFDNRVVVAGGRQPVTDTAAPFDGIMHGERCPCTNCT
jgi:hypothetical protein